LVDGLIASLKKLGSKVLNDPYIKDLMVDLTGEIHSAFADSSAYSKWGRHYLPSLRCAHYLQQCNNFKDPGVQHYGGDLFKTIRSLGDQVFLSLPPPTPSKPVYSGSSSSYGGGYSSHSSHSAPLQSMSSYYSNSVPCFAGQCTVLMGNGSLSLVQSIKKGDIVMTQHGASKVVCVVKTHCFNNQTELVEFPSGLIITPWHPIRLNNKWIFPANIQKPSIQPCEAVYSFILTSGHTMYINEIECCTLGHNMTGPIISHSYLGTNAVLDDLSKTSGFPSGLIELHAGCLQRDKQTNLISGILTSPISL